MKASNLFVAFFTFLLLCCGNVALADDMTGGKNSTEMSDITVNINTADAKSLASKLDGIGMSRAKAIVAYREAHGRFYSAEELSAVRGIGMSTVDKNASKIVVND